MILILAKNALSADLCATENGLKNGQYEFVRNHYQLELLACGRHIWACPDYQDNPECFHILTMVKARNLKLVKPRKVRFEK